MGVQGVSVWIRQSGRARLGGRYTLVVSEPRFRRFLKKYLNDFKKDFENGILHTLHLHIKDDMTLTRILSVLIGKHG